jgi:protein gp37
MSGKYYDLAWDPVARVEEKGRLKACFQPDELIVPYGIKKPAKILACGKCDLFGEEIQYAWIGSVLFTIMNNPVHTFLLLTKNPERFYGLGKFFSDNLWLGVTVTHQGEANRIFHLRMQTVKTKIVSFDPLLGEVKEKIFNVEWIIIGANPYRMPRKEWVQPLIDQARERGIPVFLKDNLGWPETIREFPKTR